jgi:hypothetical protein
MQIFSKGNYLKIGFNSFSLVKIQNIYKVMVNNQKNEYKRLYMQCRAEPARILNTEIFIYGI